MFLDALDVMGYFIKSKLIILIIMFMKLEAITYLMDGYSDQIFDCFIQLDLYKIDYAKKYIEKAGNRFEQSCSRNKVFTVKQILKQVLANLSKIGF
ncbi:exported protein A EppA (plasmid) [Borreliella garinii]|nr:exported protein A EppA [Borreliella garinii]WNZ67167.1 exported protein A EppA [Borreliella garinii]WNZ68165.1 exported protein A EppA [Borreliella garinii]WNZ69165.1 exported protein A EppA [Borreliella garinii]WNZ71169.1 exported protein A EppA [Borreliella garinii]